MTSEVITNGFPVPTNGRASARMAPPENSRQDRQIRNPTVQIETPELSGGNQKIELKREWIALEPS